MNKATKKQTKTAAGHTIITSEQVAFTAPEQAATSEGFALCIRALRQNWRQGTVACKGRSDVAYTNKKPWKQKGTGRARAGSARSPLWRGGGVIFGPQERSRMLQVSKTMRKNVLRTLAAEFLQAGRVVSLPALTLERPKTSTARTALHNAGLLNEKILLFIPSHDALTAASFANLGHVQVRFFDQPNVYDLANAQRWVILDKDIEHFKTMVAQWL